MIQELGSIPSSKQREKSSEKMYYMEGFYRQNLCGTRKLLVKEKKGLFQVRLPFLRGMCRVGGRRCLRQTASISFEGDGEGPHDRLLHCY